jgi:hypothetical protein
MSKHNKANKNNYDQGGRLSQDEMARERMNQGTTTGRAKSKENLIGKTRSSPGGPEPSRPRTGREESE